MAAKKKAMTTRDWEIVREAVSTGVKRAKLDDFPSELDTDRNPFRPAQPPPCVKVPSGTKIAMDSFAGVSWAAQATLNGAFYEGQEFLGYPYLSQLMQRPEYRRISETIATEMTRRWIKLTTDADTGKKSTRVKKITKELERLRTRDVFREAALQDGAFGRSHIFIDTGAKIEDEERKLSIGNGRDDVSITKMKKKPIVALRNVEPVWCYPLNYNSNDPTSPTWYRPDTWVVMATATHATRLLTFVGREVPDLLKPAYSFGGLSLSQMAKPYVDNWLKTRQAVSDLVQSFSFVGLKTNLQTLLSPGGNALQARMAAFTAWRGNQGTLLLNKDEEEWFNISTPLSTLDILQAQSQEHMAAVSGIPLVKLLGIQPTGLNADSEGVMRCFYDWIAAQQELLFRQHLRTIIDFIQLSLFGDVDESIGFKFESLWALDEKGQADVEKTKADTAGVYVDMGAIDRAEVRQALADDEDSPYHGIDVDNIPDDPNDIDITGSGEEDDEDDKPLKEAA